MKKTAVILMPNSQSEFDTASQKLINHNMPEEQFSCEIIVVVEKGIELNFEPTIRVPAGMSFEQKANMARYLISDTVRYLLFFSGQPEQLTPEFLLNRVRAYQVEPVIGIVGKLGEKVVSEVHERLQAKMLSILNISEADFKARNCLDDGSFRTVDWASISTTVDLFDLIGGFPIRSEAPVAEYCLRAQSLGYGILPQPE